jgi:hypothetical protein
MSAYDSNSLILSFDLLVFILPPKTNNYWRRLEGLCSCRVHGMTPGAHTEGIIPSVMFKGM